MQFSPVVARQLALAAFAAAVALGSAGNARRAAAPPAKLAPEPAAATALRGQSQEAWRASVETALENLTPFAPLALSGAPREEKAGAGGHSGGKGKEASQGPVSMQVPQEEIDSLSGNLSSGCSRRFAAMLRGQGPQLHTFGSRNTKSTEATCARLNGTICSTKAHVLQYRESSDGRSWRSSVQVLGDGCLPRECMGTSDLQLLANFMQLKAKDTIPGMDVFVSLYVDCTANGGSAVAVRDSVLAGEQQQAEEAVEHEHEHEKAEKATEHVHEHKKVEKATEHEHEHEKVEKATEHVHEPKEDEKEEHGHQEEKPAEGKEQADGKGEHDARQSSARGAALGGLPALLAAGLAGLASCSA